MNDSTHPQPQDGDVLYTQPRHYPGATVPIPPTPTPNTLTLSEQATELLRKWIDDPELDRHSLLVALHALFRMGARAYVESENLIVCETPHLQVGMYRDPRRQEVTLHS